MILTLVMCSLQDCTTEQKLSSNSLLWLQGSGGCLYGLFILFFRELLVFCGLPPNVALGQAGFWDAGQDCRGEALPKSHQNGHGLLWHRMVWMPNFTPESIFSTTQI